MKYLATVCVLASLAIAIGTSAEMNDDASQQKYCRPFPWVVVPEGAPTDHKEIAEELAKAIGSNIVSEGKSNPVCCVWIEITKWAPNPGQAGYVIINQFGGSVVLASDIEQLRAAVNRFKASMRDRGDHVEVPIGLMTNYPIIENR